jgi:hypothetical protein
VLSSPRPRRRPYGGWGCLPRQYAAASQHVFQVRRWSPGLCAGLLACVHGRSAQEADFNTRVRGPDL